MVSHATGVASPASYRPEPGSIPTRPGVYRFRDARDRVIYVGKAKNLRARLSNYFAPLHTLHERTRRMVTSAASVEWTVVRTDVEALNLEITWINELKPPFNGTMPGIRAWFAAHHYGVRPDLVTFAKAVTSGYQPLGGVIISDAIREAIYAQPADEVALWIRGMDDVPGAWSPLAARGPVKLFRPKVVNEIGGFAGEVIEAGDGGVLIACGLGAVRVAEVQPPGKRRMRAGDWVRGRGVSVGDRFGGEG